MPYEKIFDTMSSTKSTFTTPASGSGWATAKPWEAFSTGTICFFHPLYDTQGHVIPTLDDLSMQDYDDETRNLVLWLRVNSPEELQARVNAIESDQSTYEWLAQAQMNHLRSALTEQRCVTAIEGRLT